jgi:hypothetical protein
MSLESYINRKNAWASLVKSGKTYDINNLSADDKRQLAESIECDLSPENLTCDGERPRNEVEFVAKSLYNALMELESMA